MPPFGLKRPYMSQVKPLSELVAEGISEGVLLSLLHGYHCSVQHDLEEIPQIFLGQRFLGRMNLVFFARVPQNWVIRQNKVLR